MRKWPHLYIIMLKRLEFFVYGVCNINKIIGFKFFIIRMLAPFTR